MYRREDFPDHSKLCKFQNGLVETGLLENVLNTITSQFEAQGLKIQEGSIAIVDATVIERVARPMKKPTKEESREVSTEEKSNQEPRQLSKDPDATVFKRGNSCVVCYKKT